MMQQDHILQEEHDQQYAIALAEVRKAMLSQAHIYASIYDISVNIVEIKITPYFDYMAMRQKISNDYKAYDFSTKHDLEQHCKRCIKNTLTTIPR